MSRRSVRTLIVVCLAGLLALGQVSAALARIVERDRYTFTDEWTDEICGIDVEIEHEASGVFMIRSDSKDPRPFYGSDVFEYRTVVTNPANGKWAVERGRGNFRELRATHVEDDIFLFRAQLTGHHFIIENSDGEVVYRERGRLVFEILFDTLGDDVPGGEFLGGELVEIRGHPGWIDDLCPLAHELLG
jgi:hypothetical protein